MLWVLAAVGFTLLLVYIVHTLFVSNGSDCADTSFEAFVDSSSISRTLSNSNEESSSRTEKYRCKYDKPGRQIIIIYGTEYGCSEELARELFDNIESRASGTENFPIQPRIVNAKNFSVVDLMQESCLFVIISTAGDGVPPTDAREFVTWLLDSRCDLSHLRYSVLALGDSNYVHFCKAGKTVDQRLAELGAQCITSRKDVDSEDREAVQFWFGSVLQSLDVMDIEPKLDYLDVTGVDDDEDSSGPSREKPFWSLLKTKYDLTRNSELGDKETIHCEFDITDSGLQWTSGDALGIYPENNPADVDAILRALNHSGVEMVPMPRWAYRPQTGDLLQLREALLHFYDLKNVKAELLLTLMKQAAKGSANNNNNNHLLESLLKDGLFKTNSILQNYLNERQVPDVLQEFSKISSDISINDILAQMKPLLPRYYSISSSPVVDPGTVCTALAVVRYQTLGKDRTGVTTTFLQDRLPIGQSCPVFISRNPNFRLPTDSTLPIIMIGPGTGLAPFRAFIQERIALMASGLNLLYFGCRQRNQDFLYRDELERWVILGKLELRTAFSREQKHKIYVQDLISEDGSQIWNLLCVGAHLYVCGDARHMAHDVHSALLGIIKIFGEMHADGSAEQFLSKLESEGRYQRETWVT